MVGGRGLSPAFCCWLGLGFEAWVLFFGVFGAVCAGLVSFAHFAAGFFSVAGFAEGLEVV